MVLLGAISSLFAACGDDAPPDECADVTCGACYEPINLTIVFTGAETAVTVVGIDLTCSPGDPGTAICFGGTGAGAYVGRIEADGYTPVDIAFEVATDPSTGCCACGYVPYMETYALIPAGGDGG
jgi:hypothetical protein